MPTILFRRYAKRSIIDLTLASSDFVCHSSTGLDTAGSDHFPIFTTIGGNFKIKKMFLYKLKINKKDLALLHHSLLDNLRSLNSILSENSLVAYQQLETKIKQQLYAFFSSDSRLSRSCALRKYPAPPPWWNDKCQLAIEKRKDATRKCIISPTLTNFINYKHIRSTSSKILKKQKRLGWKKFCSQFNHKTPTTEIWALIKLFKKRKFTKTSVILDSNLQSQLAQATIAKLCSPSCLH